MSKHTPGPWQSMGEGVIIPLKSIYCERIGYQIAFVNTDKKSVEAEAEANARLISQAPAMLEALEEMLEVHGVRWEHVRGDSSIPASWVELSDKARAAIKAAKGEA